VKGVQTLICFYTTRRSTAPVPRGVGEQENQEGRLTSTQRARC